MNRIRIVARALSPLVINEERQSSNSISLGYIPGSTLRGSLAGAYLRAGGKADDQSFQSLFLKDAPSIPNLIPATGPHDEPRPFPFTTLSCKRNPGFLDKEKHGVVDLLAITAASRVSGEPADPSLWNCGHPGCTQELKPLAGFWNGDGRAPKRCQASLSYNRFTGIDRTSRTVAQSIFYTSRSIDDLRHEESGENTPQFFIGITSMGDEAYSALQQIAKNPIFVGADKTRGYGEIELKFEDTDQLPNDYEKWDREFRSLCPVDLPEGLLFAITFASHGIFVDPFLRPTHKIDLGLKGVEEVMKVARKTKIRGWNAAWGMPKADDTGVMMGSVYLFRYMGQDKALLAEHLERLRKEGVGLRREEGFGMVAVDDQLHISKEAL